MGQALSSAHRAGICHLDVKPENIILTDPGTPEARVTLVDFGVAHLHALPSRAAGTTRYMAPEQSKSPSPKCDLYALALVASEMSLGRLPDLSKPIATQIEGPTALREAIAQALRADPAARQADIPPFLQQALAEPRSSGRIAWLGAAVLGAAVAIGLAWQPFKTRPIHWWPLPS